MKDLIHRGTPDFYLEVIKEIVNIKKFANDKQIAKLDFNTLIPRNANRCVYGQMTGSCYNQQAKLLIELCANQDQSFVIHDPHNKSPLRKRPRNENHLSHTFLEAALFDMRPHEIEATIMFLQKQTNYLAIGPASYSEKSGMILKKTLL